MIDRPQVDNAFDALQQLGMEQGKYPNEVDMSSDSSNRGTYRNRRQKWGCGTGHLTPKPLFLIPVPL